MLTVGGASSFTVAGGVTSDINLGTQTNDFGGALVTVNATGAGSAIGTFTLKDKNIAALLPTLTATPINLTLD